MVTSSSGQPTYLCAYFNMTVLERTFGVVAPELAYFVQVQLESIWKV